MTSCEGPRPGKVLASRISSEKSRRDAVATRNTKGVVQSEELERTDDLVRSLFAMPEEVKTRKAGNPSGRCYYRRRLITCGCFRFVPR
jgi:hypothetical protein